MIILEGKTKAEEIKNQIKEEIKKTGIRLGLAVILVGDDPASKIYIKNKERACNEVGIYFHKYLFTLDCQEADILETIKFLNKDKSLNGILIQLPLPKKFDTNKIIESINPAKDVDGFHSVNLAKILANKPAIIPPSIQGVMTMLELTKEDLRGKNISILAKGEIFPKPLKALLERKGSKVEVILSQEKNWPERIKEADILITAIGQPKVIRKEMVKEGVIIIDVSTTYIEGKLFGDADFNDLTDKASFITPVPGGIGPLTVAYLLKNLLDLAKH